MILNTEILQKYKNYLILLDYPFIKQQNDIEIQNIFEKDNRTLLLSWLIVKYLPSCNNKIEEAKKDNKIDSFLTTIIYENGFCRSAEKDLFVKGILDEDKQIVIFNKIFSILSLLHSNNSIQEIITEEDIKLKQLFMKPSEELKNKIIPEVNLFPTQRLPNKMTNAERKKKLDAYKEEVYNMKSILEMEEKELQPFASEMYTSSNYNTENIEHLVMKFKKIMTEFNKDDFINFTENKIGLVTSSNKSKLENVVAVNSKEISSLSQTLEKKRDLQKFGREESISENDDSISNEDDFSVLIRQNFFMSNNIIEEAIRNCEN